MLEESEQVEFDAVEAATSLLDQLLALSRQAHAHLDRSDGEAVLAILERRATLIVSSEGAVRRYARTRDGLLGSACPSGGGAEVQRRCAGVAQLAAELQASDTALIVRLRESRDRIRSNLQQLEQASTATASYRPGAAARHIDLRR